MELARLRLSFPLMLVALLPLLGGCGGSKDDAEKASSTVAPVEDPGALRPDTFGPYFRGIRYGTFGLAGRLTDDGDRAEAMAMIDMAGAFLDPWKVRRPQ